MQSLVDRSLADGLFTHVYAAAGFFGEAKPRFRYEKTPDGKTIFDLASLTKALVTTPLAFSLREDRKIDSFDATLGEAFGAEWPAGLDERLRSLTVASLLRHESGLPAWRNYWICRLGLLSDAELNEPRARRERIIAVTNRALAAPPNAKQQTYSDVGFLLLGLLVETLGGAPLDRQFNAFCEQKLALPNRALPLCYASELADRQAAIPTGYCPLRQRDLVGEVHDENCAALGGVSAHAGLFGSGDSVVKFLSALRATKIGLELIEANRLCLVLPLDERALQNANESLLGWRQAADHSSFPFGRGKGMGHMGFTGTAFWIEPEEGAYGVVLTNRVAAGRMRPGIAGFRREAFRALWQVIHSLST